MQISGGTMHVLPMRILPSLKRQKPLQETSQRQTEILMCRRRKQAAKEDLLGKQEQLEAEKAQLLALLACRDQEIASMRQQLAAADMVNTGVYDTDMLPEAWVI